MANPHDDKHKHEHHHFILPDKTAVSVGVALLILTVITVWVAGIDLGKLNFPVAMLVATTKAFLVCAIFMGLKYDKKENTVIFATSFLFLAIFISFTATDWFFRGDVYVKAGQTFGTPAKSKFLKAWEPTPALVAHGKELYAQQCVSCHGAEGAGNGPAAGALVPPPRNFTTNAAWKNGRKPSMVFKTLKEGIPGSAMASYSTLPPDDRWALSHYVITLGPKPEPKDSKDDLAKIGVDPSKDGGGAVAEAPTIPVEVAMAQLADDGPKLRAVHGGQAPGAGTPGGQLYASHCASCHGDQGEGGKMVTRGGYFLRTEPFVASSEGVASAERFKSVVVRGLPGELMPGNGQLSPSQIGELHQYVRTLSPANK